MALNQYAASCRFCSDKDTLEMVHCKQCNGWYHLQCVNADSSVNSSRWICQMCVKRAANKGNKSSRSSTSSKRRSLQLEKLTREKIIQDKLIAEKAKLAERLAEVDDKFLQKEFEIRENMTDQEDDDEIERAEFITWFRDQYLDFLSTNVVPTSAKQSFVPVSAKQLNMPTSAKQSLVPNSAKQSNVPVLVQQSNAPVSAQPYNVSISTKQYNVSSSNLRSPPLVLNTAHQLTPVHQQRTIPDSLGQLANTVPSKKSPNFANSTPPRPTALVSSCQYPLVSFTTTQHQSGSNVIPQQQIGPNVVPQQQSMFGSNLIPQISGPNIVPSQSMYGWNTMSQMSVPNVPPHPQLTSGSNIILQSNFSQNPNMPLNALGSGQPPPPTNPWVTYDPGLNPQQLPPTRLQLAARQTISKDYPKFNGDPEKWLIFYNSYANCTTSCGLSNGENLSRLERCLEHPARKAIQNLLTRPEAVPDIMETLKMLYGRPEASIEAQLKVITNETPPRMHKMETFIDFAMSVRNVTSEIQKTGMWQYLWNPQLMQQLVDKLPYQMRLEWGQIKLSTPNLNLSSFSDWLFLRAQTACAVTLPSSSDKRSNSNANSHVNTRFEVNSSKTNEYKKVISNDSCYGSEQSSNEQSDDEQSNDEQSNDEQSDDDHPDDEHSDKQPDGEQSDSERSERSANTQNDFTNSRWESVTKLAVLDVERK